MRQKTLHVIASTLLLAACQASNLGESGPLDANAYTSRGRASYTAGRTDEAIRDFGQAIRLDPRQVEAFIGRADAWISLERSDEALRDYGEAIRLGARDARVYSNYGVALASAGECDRAIRAYDEALRLDPAYVSALGNRGHAWLAKNEPEKAVRDYAAALEQGESDPTVAVLGALAARHFRSAPAAKRFLEHPADKLARDWPYPAFRYLRGEIGEAALLELAADNTAQIQARSYAGLAHASEGRRDQALAHLRWVKAHGAGVLAEYALAMSALERLEQSGR